MTWYHRTNAHRRHSIGENNMSAAQISGAVEYVYFERNSPTSKKPRPLQNFGQKLWREQHSEYLNVDGRTVTEWILRWEVVDWIRLF
jgi:hypothetical protein